MPCSCRFVNTDGSILRDGVRIEDCGEKLGLNGVDNGRIWFDQVRIPRENLLDRFAQVAADGTYSSPITSPSRRFFTMLGTLVGGRVSVALAGLSASKSALTIAVRYGAGRRQFGPGGEAETVLLDYLTHQRRLLPRLATTYALNFALHQLAEQYAESTDDDRREVEAMAAGLKAYATWHATDTIQTCRETCGGQGYLAANRFAALKADSDVFTTFEGDNTVLMQLVAKGAAHRLPAPVRRDEAVWPGTLSGRPGCHRRRRAQSHRHPNDRRGPPTRSGVSARCIRHQGRTKVGRMFPRQRRR